MSRVLVRLFSAVLLTSVCLLAQGQSDPPATPAGPEAEAAPSGAIAPGSVQGAEPPGGKRVFGVLPNYRTADASLEGTVLTHRQKLAIASKDSFDYPLLALGGAFAALGQWTDQDPSFGQGMKGYAHRWVTNYADQAIGNMFTEGVFPVLLSEDPRYFRRGEGSKKGRALYAATRVLITHKDSGGTRFNFSEWVGNAGAVAISQAYYPENRTPVDAFEKLLEQVGTDATSQVLKEFWPDIKRRWFSKKASPGKS
jgi:hypothetical protein